MSFAPALPASGLLGWTFLKRTEAAQSASFSRQPVIQRDEAYFRDRIGTIRTAEDLVQDRRLLRISLEAFGLEADVNARAFIRKVLEDGTLKVGALANKLVDPRYKALASAFGFGDFSVPRTVLSGFPDEILTRWKDRRFEAAVGSVDGNLRLAMNARSALAELAQDRGSETAKWFRILGNAPLWKVVQPGLGLPGSFATADPDRQLAELKARADRLFGDDSVSQFRDPEKVERLIQRFLVRSELQANTAAANPALVLLQQGSFLRRL